MGSSVGNTDGRAVGFTVDTTDGEMLRTTNGDEEVGRECEGTVVGTDDRVGNKVGAADGEQVGVLEGT